MTGDDWMAVQIITDSTSYINKNVKEELKIKIVSLIVTFGNDSFKETGIKSSDFYDMMDKRGVPISSQPSIQDLYEKMKTILIEGDDALCVFLSSAMSGTFSTAHIAKEMVLEEFKDGKIEIIDSKSNCMQLGFCACLAARAAREGENLNELRRLVEENIRRSRFLFIPDNLTYLRKGGRIGGAGALLGSILKIIPILTVEGGVTTVLSKVRTKRKAVKAMLNKVISDIDKFGLGEIVVHHINCLDEATELSEKIKELLGLEVEICDIGPVIGLHVGPGAIGIAYYTKENMR